jgi:thiol-disulfide isomerase/thioredoxin
MRSFFVAISKKSHLWLAPALLVAIGCSPTVETAKFEVEDDSNKTETVATKSNGEFANKGGDEEARAVSSEGDEEMEGQEQEPGKNTEEKKPSKKPAKQDQQDKPKETSIADMELPKDGKLEDYEKFMQGLMTAQPTSQAEADKRMTLIGDSAKKILELNTDKATDSWKQAFGVTQQLKVFALMPKFEAALTAEEDKKADEMKAVQAAIDEYLAPVADKKADDEVALVFAPLMQMLQRIPDEDFEKIKVAVVEKFAPKFEEAEAEDLKAFGKMLAGSIRLPKLVGDEMKLTGKTTEGKDFDVKEWKGKVVLVDFWATWCGPCIAEYPNMLKNYEKYHNQGLEIVGISADHQLEDLTTYIEKKKVPWPNLYTEGGHEAAEYYGIDSIPRMILIGRDGKVVSINARGEELNRLLEEQFTSTDAPAEGEKKAETKEEEKKEEPKEGETKEETPKAEEKPTEKPADPPETPKG